MNQTDNKMKRVLSLLLSLILVFFLITPGIRALAEEELVVTINSVEDLKQAAKQCRLDTYSQNKRFELTTDLNLSEEDFENFPTFGGTFHGNGHTISGFFREFEGSNQGFFRYVQESGKIEDLILIGKITSNGSSTNIGTIAGVNRGTIRNCSVTVSLNGENTIGGVVGLNESSGVVNRCNVRGSVAGEHYTGGIVGKNLGVVSGCTNYANVNTSLEEVTLGIDDINLEQINSTENVSVNTDTGGIAGFSSGSITGSTNRGQIGYQHVGYNIGGIVGRQSGYIEDCYNYGIIHGRKDVAGIAGQMEPYLLLQYSEDVTQKLEAAFDQLDIAMDQLLDDMSITSSNLSGHLDQVVDLLDLVRQDFNNLSDQTVDYANSLMDSADDIFERVDLALNRTHSVLDTMESASDDLTDSLNQLEKAVESVDDVSDDGQIVINCLSAAIEDLSDASAHLNTAIKDAKNIRDLLKEKFHQETTENEESSSEISSDTTGNGESVSETPSDTTGNGESVSETPSDTTGNGESVSETPSDTTGNGESVSETPSDTTENGESVSETPSNTTGNGESVSETPSDITESKESVSENSSNITEQSGADLETIFGLEKIEESEEIPETAGISEENSPKQPESTSLDLESVSKWSKEELESILKELESATGLDQEQLESISKELETATLPHQEQLESVSKELESISLEHQEQLESMSKELESFLDPANRIHHLLLRFFTEEELKNLDANLTDLGDQLQYASRDLKWAFSALEEMKPYFDSMGESGNDMEKYVEDAMDFMEKASTSISDAFDKADTIIDALEGDQAVSFPKLDSGYQSLIDSISDLCNRVLDVLKVLNSDTESHSQSITDDIRRINDCIVHIEDIVLDAINDNQEEEEEERDENGFLIFEEASNEETEHILQGKLKNSYNYGTIEADIAVGGVVGNMAIEYDLDPEEDIHIEGEHSLNFRYKTSTVLSDSINYGEIVAKKDYAGGIVGKMDLGTARNCQSYGDVTSEGGKYVGGIAGGSSALIENSYTRCKLSGGKYVGGIAGLAYDLNHCYSLIRIEEATEFYGAIAGDISKNGMVYNNYFVSGDWDGIDRVSYATMAMPISYEQMVATEGFPEEFTQFMLRFVADDTAIAEIPFHYGDSLSEDAIPEVPKKDGYYAAWEDYDYQNMEFNETIEAVYTKELTVIASEDKLENGKMPVFLLEGIFDEDAKVELTDRKKDFDISLGEQESLLANWHITVQNQNRPETDYIAHLAKPADTNQVQLYHLQDGNWTEIAYEESGSYLIFSMSGNTADICLVGASHTKELMTIVALAGVLFLGVLLILLHRKRKKKKKRKKEQQIKETA